MNKLFLWIAAASAFVLQSCEKTDGIRDEIADLQDRVTALEGTVAGVNRDIVALHRLMDESTVIVGVTPTAEGYDLELSDGTTLPVVLGEKLEALVPLLGIDAEGYWTVSLDKGATEERLLVDGEPVSAWPSHGGDHKPGAAGITPQLKVDTDGTWLVSCDGTTFTPLLLNGEKINALGDKVVISYSIFKSVGYDAAKGVLTVELTTGEKLTLGVEDTFSLTIAAQATETFLLAETRVFEVEQRNVAGAALRVPSGWTAQLEETLLTVTAPRTAKGAAEAVEIAVIATSEKGYIKIAKLNISLLDKQLDADACEAWRNFKAGTEDLLLDYSYAGYKHGEEAPADVWGLGYKVCNVVDYGADPTGATSSRAALLALLKELKLTGQSDAGANLANPNAKVIIYFPEGRFVLHNDDDNVKDPSSANQTELDAFGNNKSEEIFIRGGNFVLKGAGRDKTTLVMDTPNLPNNAQQMWSSPVMLNIKHNAAPSDLTPVTADAPRGSFSVKVGSTANIGVGDWVCLRLSNNDPALVAQELAPHVVDNADMTNIQTIQVTDYHQVKSVSGGEVTFFEPLMHAVEARWNWTLQRYPHYENVGVEDLAFEGRSKEGFGHHASWQDDGAYKPLNMMRLANSWIRRVDFRHVSEALSIVSSANCSAYDIAISGNRGHSGVRSQASSRVFIGKVTDRSRGAAVSPPMTSSGFFENAGQYHASGVSETALGTVLWNNTWGDDALFEAHSRQPRATLVDRCTGGFVQWRFGGDEASVPNHLGDLTLWNLHATRVAHDFGAEPFKWWLTNDRWWKTMPPIIVGFHGEAVRFDTDPSQLKYLESNGVKVQPESLYEAQLRERLGYVPAWLNALK